MTAPLLMKLVVHAVERPHPLVVTLDLRAADCSPLPPFTAGAHIRVQVHLAGGTSDWRHYSLVDLDPALDAPAAPTRYLLGVRLEDAGRGGSRWMHGLMPGAEVTAEAPRNDFPLGSHAGCAVLVAGGIGVTPLSAMATARRRAGLPVRMVYAGRARAQLAFLATLQRLMGDALQLHADDEAGRPLDAEALLDGCAADDVLYVCGPRPLLDALLAGAARRGWPPERVRFELFSAPQSQDGDQGFDVLLRRSGRTVRVDAKQSILECLEAAGCDPLFDCRRGECGVCAVDVLEAEGGIDHRDHVLSSGEKAANRVIQICVSRSRGPRLVLDL